MHWKDIDPKTLVVEIVAYVDRSMGRWSLQCAHGGIIRVANLGPTGFQNARGMTYDDMLRRGRCTVTVWDEQAQSALRALNRIRGVIARRRDGRF